MQKETRDLIRGAASTILKGAACSGVFDVLPEFTFKRAQIPFSGIGSNPRDSAVKYSSRKREEP